MSESEGDEQEDAPAVICQDCGAPNRADALYCALCYAMLDAEWEGSGDDGGDAGA